MEGILVVFGGHERKLRSMLMPIYVHWSSVDNMILTF